MLGLIRYPHHVPSMILALDQGTTSSRSILFDRESNIRDVAQVELSQSYPQPGWVEHDPEEIWRGQLATARQVVGKVGTDEIAAIGITNQRETTILWDRKTGEAVHPAIVWQDRRTAGHCDALIERGLGEMIAVKTGLVIDAYFSATKLSWLLNNVPGVRSRAEKGELAFGTVDTYLIWRLTGGRSHVTDPSNASRTMLFDIERFCWDDELLALFNIPMEVMPKVVASSEHFDETSPEIFGRSVPIAGIAGDQQAATFGQCCFRPGMVKSTYGTGCFLLMNVGDGPKPSQNRLLSTVLWERGPSIRTREADPQSVERRFGLEGSVFVAGAAIQWLRDELGLISSAQETAAIASQVSDTAGVYLVPAFAGLGAPYWDPHARGALVGLTRGAGKPHIVRAALESIAYQCRDVLEAMQADCGTKLHELRVDGGAATNDFLLQFQADILGIPVVRPKITETTALGAAYLAGLSTGFWQETELESSWRVDRTFEPAMIEARRGDLVEGWNNAVKRTLS